MPAMKWKQIDLVWADNATVSGTFSVEPWAIFYGALFPAMIDGDVGLELTIDGTNYNPVIDPTDGLDAVLVASGADPGWVDFSDWVRFFGHNLDLQAGSNTNLNARFTCVSQTDGPLTISVLMRG
jgi:hypothetical protein